jgi:hypothetical protein
MKFHLKFDFEGDESNTGVAIIVIALVVAIIAMLYFVFNPEAMIAKLSGLADLLHHVH